MGRGVETDCKSRERVDDDLVVHAVATPAAGASRGRRITNTCRRPLNGIRHAQAVTWQLHVVIILDRFSGFWRWMSLDRSGQLWTAAIRQRFKFPFALIGENRKRAS